jgi:chorismate mutase
MDELENLRLKIDEIDESIIELFSERFKVTQKVALVKKKHNLEAIDSSREARQMEKIAKLSSKNKINTELMKNIFRLVIDDVVKNHKVVKIS